MRDPESSINQTEYFPHCGSFVQACQAGELGIVKACCCCCCCCCMSVNSGNHLRCFQKLGSYSDISGNTAETSLHRLIFGFLPPVLISVKRGNALQTHGAQTVRYLQDRWKLRGFHTMSEFTVVSAPPELSR